MANDKDSFRELLGDAPLLAKVTTMVGSLVRSSDPEKFVLMLADGRSLPLNIDSVQNYSVLARSAGQIIVSVDVDTASVPAEMNTASSVPFSLLAPFQSPMAEALARNPASSYAQIATRPLLDRPKNPEADLSTPPHHDV